VEVARDAGLPIDGFTHALDASAIRHVRKAHGNEETEAARGQIAVTDEDLKNLPETLREAKQVIFALKNRRDQDQIAYLTTLSDGSTLVIEEVRTGKHDLALASVRKYPGTMSVEAIAATLDPNAQGDTGDGISIVDVPENVSPIDFGRVQTLSQPDGGIGPRGPINFSDADNILINLFKSENLSTFLHGSGHLYLKMMGGQTDQPER